MVLESVFQSKPSFQMPSPLTCPTRPTWTSPSQSSAWNKSSRKYTNFTEILLITNLNQTSIKVALLPYLGPLTTLLVPLGVATPGLAMATGLATVVAVDVAASAISAC